MTTPRPRTDLPFAVRMIEHVEIPVRDGVRLAARVWLPEGAADAPAPAVLHMVPYRKDDFTAVSDSADMGYVAAHGYATVRVDLRGSGSSEGILSDEYSDDELADACDVIAWLARQPWCSGAVGMTGYSWGGFNALQVAARRPPALRAIVSACSTDDRYADDVHYFGGCLLTDDLIWATIMLDHLARPPDPAVVGERWRAMWLDRLERTPALAGIWMRHQRRDDYWRRGSICEDYGAIAVPVYLVGGWADSYRRAIFRMLQHLGVPVKALIGPWGHMWPHLGIPGPAIGWLQESIRWWDRWLKGVDNGVMDGPTLRVWMQEPSPSYTTLEAIPTRPGRWVGEPGWPSPNVRRSELFPSGSLGLEDRPPDATVLEHRGAALAGVDVGRRQTCDQRDEDARWLSFTSAPLPDRIEILGLPELSLEIASDRDRALLAVRLCAVAPDGSSELLTMGLLDLAHRDGHASPEPLVPGRRYVVRVELLPIAQAVPAGYRLRVALSSTFWRAWPSPEDVTLSVRTGPPTRLTVPVRSTRGREPAMPAFGEPETGVSIARIERHPPPIENELRVDADGWYEHRHGRPAVDVELVRAAVRWTHFYEDIERRRDGHPLSMEQRCRRVSTARRGDWDVRVEAASHLVSTSDELVLTSAVDAYESGRRVFSRSSTERIPRDLI